MILLANNFYVGPAVDKIAFLCLLCTSAIGVVMTQRFGPEFWTW